MHQLHYETVPENCNKSLIEAELNEMCERESDWGSGLPYPIVWKDLIFNSLDEARAYIEEHDGSYLQIAVKYRSYSELTYSKKYDDLKSRYSIAFAKCNMLEDEFHFKDHSSAFIGCKECGSRISHAYLRTNYCPVCSNDLRPETTLKRIRILNDKVEKLQKELKAEEAKLQAKQIKNAEIRWLIKIEYHC